VSIRFLADEDIDADIIEGLRAREPAIDILDVKTGGLRATEDPDLLELAAQQDRVLISYDRRTMTRHFWDRVRAGKPSPGLFIFPQEEAMMGEIIESLLLVWAESEPEEWRNGVAFLPFR